MRRVPRTPPDSSRLLLPYSPCPIQMLKGTNCWWDSETAPPTQPSRACRFRPCRTNSIVDRSRSPYYSGRRMSRQRKSSPGFDVAEFWEGMIDPTCNCQTSGYINSKQLSQGLYGWRIRLDTGDNGPAVSARLNQPLGIAVDATGSIYVVDSGNDRVRQEYERQDF